MNIGGSLRTCPTRLIPFAYQHGADTKAFLQGKALELGDCDDANLVDEKAPEDAEGAEQTSIPPPKEKGKKAVKEKTTSAGQSSKGPKSRTRSKQSAATPLEVDSTSTIPKRTAPPVAEALPLTTPLPSQATTSGPKPRALSRRVPRRLRKWILRFQSEQYHLQMKHPPFPLPCRHKLSPPHLKLLPIFLQQFMSWKSCCQSLT